MNQSSEADGVLTFLACALLLGAPFIAAATGLWATACQWLTEHHILTSQSVQLSIPGTAGAGLDAPRILLAAGALLAAAAGAILLHRRTVRRRELGLRR